MIQTLYIEKEIANHPRTLEMIAQFPNATHISCDRYTEIFNRKAQNFRLQKQQPSLILAEKFIRQILPAPNEYNIGANHNYYFSHMLNCIYDCRYCFLQGMYRSAHYVLFINYEDFRDEIIRTCRQHTDENVHFFSGYDCDSLALEPISGFVEFILTTFQILPNGLLELRTKSTQIRCLLQRPPMDNIVVAFSLSPQEIAQALEHKTPDLEKRLEAIAKLQTHGWPIGLRFDPLIYDQHFKRYYMELFQTVFSKLDPTRLHSVSLGSFRLPESYFNRMQKLYPDSLLLATHLQKYNKMVGYPKILETELYGYCEQILTEFVPKEIIYPCLTTQNNS